MWGWAGWGAGRVRGRQGGGGPGERRAGWGGGSSGGGGTCVLVHKNVRRNRVECSFRADPVTGY